MRRNVGMLGFKRGNAFNDQDKDRYFSRGMTRKKGGQAYCRCDENPGGCVIKKVVYNKKYLSVIMNFFIGQNLEFHDKVHGNTN